MRSAMVGAAAAMAAGAITRDDVIGALDGSMNSAIRRSSATLVVADSGNGWVRYEKVAHKHGDAITDTPERRAQIERLRRRAAAAEAVGDTRRAEKLLRRAAAG